MFLDGMIVNKIDGIFDFSGLIALQDTVPEHSATSIITSKNVEFVIPTDNRS